MIKLSEEEFVPIQQDISSMSIFNSQLLFCSMISLTIVISFKIATGNEREKDFVELKRQKEMYLNFKSKLHLFKHEDLIEMLYSSGNVDNQLLLYCQYRNICTIDYLIKADFDIRLFDKYRNQDRDNVFTGLNGDGYSIKQLRDEVIAYRQHKHDK